MLSKKRIDAIKGWEDIAAAMDAEEILTGKVTEVIKGGVIVLYQRHPRLHPGFSGCTHTAVTILRL